MTRPAVLAVLVAHALPTAALAGPVERACLSAQAAQSPRLCTCLQAVADMNLQPLEQQRVARFFSDPHQSQELRTSSHPGDPELWERYEMFGTAAERLCAGES